MFRSFNLLQIYKAITRDGEIPMLRIDRKLQHGTRTPHRPHTRLHKPRGTSKILIANMSRKELKHEATEILARLDIKPEDQQGDILDMAIGFLHAFRKLDNREAGLLTREDFHGALQVLNPQENPDKFLALCDFNHDGIVSKEEFITAYVKLEITDKHYGVFAEIDTDTDGRISVEELQKAFEGGKYPPEKIRKWFKKADSNKSGYISYREFSKSPLKNKYRKVKQLKLEIEKQRILEEEKKLKEKEDAEEKLVEEKSAI